MRFNQSLFSGFIAVATGAWPNRTVLFGSIIGDLTTVMK